MKLLQWSDGGEALYVMQAGPEPIIETSRLDLDTGRRVPWRTIRIPDPGGFYPYGARITPDGKSFAATDGRGLANRFLVEGLT